MSERRAIFPGRCLVGCKCRVVACTTWAGTRGMSRAMGIGLGSSLFQDEGEDGMGLVVVAICCCI